MRTIYKVLNPNIGEYQESETKESAELLAREIAWQFYLAHTHQAPISKVVITDEGAEIWGEAQ